MQVLHSGDMSAGNYPNFMAIITKGVGQGQRIAKLLKGISIHFVCGFLKKKILKI